MKQELFEEKYRGGWQEFESWLDRLDAGRSSEASVPRPAFDAAELPARYRRLCQHLALARDRAYSADLVERLNALVLRGHHLLYGASGERKARLLAFVYGGFPRMVRAEARLVGLAAALFLGPLLLLLVMLQSHPDFVYYLINADAVAGMEKMYSPGSARLGAREADTDVGMFGFYIWNNVKIGFQTFATGLVFGIGTVAFLLFNGVYIGAIAGHLTQIGYGEPFYSFVSGHSAFELTAIVLSGAAGLKLGGALLAPGQLTRSAALTAAARAAAPLAYGAGLMFVAAAFVEAFWSPHRLVAPEAKYAIGIALWVAVLAYFAVLGRQRGP